MSYPYVGMKQLIQNPPVCNMRGHACCCDDCSHVTLARGVSAGLATLLRDGHTGMVNPEEHRMASGTRIPMRVDGSRT